MSDCKLQLGCLCVVGYLALVYCRERRHAAHRGPAAGAPSAAKLLIFPFFCAAVLTNGGKTGTI